MKFREPHDLLEETGSPSVRRAWIEISWERGSNENANIMIRRKHPKGTDFEKVSARQIAETEQWINNYPRKILGYISSEVAFRACLREIGLSA